MNTKIVHGLVGSRAGQVHRVKFRAGRNLKLLLGIGVLLLAMWPASRACAQVALVNIEPTDIKPLVMAIGEKGLAAERAAANANIGPGTRLVVLEARDGAEVSAAGAQQLGEFVRHGGSLLLTFDQNTGITPMRLAFMLPTIPWHTAGAALSRGGVKPGVSALNWDTAFFPNNEPAGISVPFHFEIEPVTAVERGMQRYDAFAYQIPPFDLDHKPGEFFWTRPLLNREWTVRLRGNDGPQTPLLITGRYGAGRVAVFASSATAVTSANEKMWADLVAWLTASAPAASTASDATPLALTVAPAASVDPAGNKCLAVTVNNESASPARETVLVRFLTWEDAMVGDAQQNFTVAPQAKATILVPFPATAATGYQSLDFRDAFDVRVGILSADQSSILSETRQRVDLDPPLGLSVQTDNLRAIPYPFAAPGSNALASFPGRMGMPVYAYAYKPGQKVSASVTLANGVSNLAPLAKVEDETQPDNPTVSALIDDSSQIEKTTRGGFGATGAWIGKAGDENVLKFTFPEPVWLSTVTLNGSPTNTRRHLTNNPGAVSIECDGKEIARDDHLDARFVAELGLVRVAFAPVRGQEIRIHLPWLAGKIDDMPRSKPELGGVILEGNVAEFPAAQAGLLTLTLHDSLAGTDSPIGQLQASVEPGETKVVPFSFVIPQTDSTAFYQLHASFGGQDKATPILGINPTKTLLPISDLHPGDAPSLNFTVTGGFRNAGIGTGVAEAPSSWENPDDLVWAYSRGLKQTGPNRHPLASMLFSLSDLGHYCNPWTSYRNGEMFFSVAAPEFLHSLKRKASWATSDKVLLGFGDRWDTGPSMNSMYTWQDFVGFDQYLRSQGKPGLKGQTHQELAEEIDSQYNGLWQNWQMTRYVQNVETLQKTFADQGKKLVISGQGIPLTPAAAGKIIAQTVRGMSDDNTWGMWDEDVPKTTGRELTYMAFDPWWDLNSNFVWGWNSAILNNSYWYAPVGTTEPSRRQYYDRAWRGAIDGDGAYRSMFTFGYGMNGGSSYCMSQNDWQQNWLAQERQSLIYPDGPIGAGLIIGTAAMENPATALFSGGGMGDSPAADVVNSIAPIFGELQHAGLSVPFMASAESLSQWKGSAPIIVADLSIFSDSEIAILKKLVDAGTPVAAFQGAGSISSAAAALFAVHTDGTADGSDIVGHISNGSAAAKLPVLAHGSTLFIPADANNLSTDDLRVLAPLLSAHLSLPVQFPDGAAGYGFTDGGLSYIVVEDWLDARRTVTIRLHAGVGKTAHAVDINNHKPLSVHRDNSDWLIDLPLRPGDGALIALSETP